MTVRPAGRVAAADSDRFAKFRRGNVCFEPGRPYYRLSCIRRALQKVCPGRQICVVFGAGILNPSSETQLNSSLKFAGAPKKQSRLHFGASRSSSLGKGRQKIEAETANRARKWHRRAPEIGLPTFQNAYTSAVSHSELRRLAEQRFRNIINFLCSPALISVLSLVLVER